MRGSSEVSVRPARPHDRPQIAAMLSQSHWRHLHLDWRDPLDTLASPPNLIAEVGGRPVGFLASPPDPPTAAWLRSFCVGPGRAPLTVWRPLWPEAAAQCAGLGVRRFASLLSAEWMRPLLADGGFRETNAVVFFERRDHPIAAADPPQELLRTLQASDLPGVHRVDARAFSLLWQNGPEALAAALSQSIVATGVEFDGRLVAYQLTTASPFGAHLARLAVDPDFQRRGLATALVVDLVHHLQRRGYDSITLNTQADNLRSQDLYRKLGFRETGQRYPVFEVSLG